ncbi:ABC transporter substrate-binding protein [Saliphagus sp. LR7]|uniref:ABC transporter substrate-binding protein n=1 Tax=Saliphagus sp. LR7 TaxID=2282654 RepID=UPI000DF75263|nr:ABC transporter substrate-binding protein [Saliphagus sp. LR7]
MRVVTTLPSGTELLASLGIDPVGVSHECDFPPRMADRPAITRSRIDASASSDEIDRQVLEAETDAEGVYEIDCEALEELDPDLIVTQGICDVCAVDERVIERALSRIGPDPEILTTDPSTVGDVLADLRRIGRAVGREERAERVAGELEARLTDLRERTPEEGPRAAVLDWTDPAMVAGHWTPELVAAAGGEYGMADPGDRSTPREWAAIREYDPEVLVVAPCGFELDQTAENRSDLTDREGWDELSAVRDGQVWAMDGHHYVNRPGPRLVDTAERLAEVLDPERFGSPPESVAVPFPALEDLDRRGERQSAGTVHRPS